MSIHTHDVDRPVRKKLKLAVILLGIIFFVELFGGILSNSLALISDAAHVFMDVFALSMSLLALYISTLPPSETRTYGFHRVEVFVAFLNGSSLLLVSLFIFYKAYARILSPSEVETGTMLAVAVVGLVANVIVAYWLGAHADDDLNVKSAFYHVIGDTIASVGVIVAGLVIRFTGWQAADPVISVFIGIIIMYGAWTICRDSSHILLEGVPPEIDLAEIVRFITGMDGVKGIHSLHIWGICHNVFALSAHIDLVPSHMSEQGEIISVINEKLAEEHHIFYTTLQLECTDCSTDDVLRSIVHRGRGHLH